MKVYRTVSEEELSKLIMRKELLPKTQKSSRCFINKNNEYVHAGNNNFNGFSCFTEKIYWFTETKHILLELDISDDQILYHGYGVCVSPIYNNFVCDIDGGLFLCGGEFGLIRNSLFKEFKFNEVYLHSYNINNVKNIYFMNGCNSCSCMVDDESIYESNYLGTYIFFLIHYLSRQLRDNNDLRYRKLNNFEMKFSWKDEVSLNFIKKFLSSILPEKEDIINKFSYYGKVDNLERNMTKSNKFNIEICSLWNFFQDMFEDDSNYKFRNLKSGVLTNEMKAVVNDVLLYNDERTEISKSYNWELPINLINQKEIIENFVFSFFQAYKNKDCNIFNITVFIFFYVLNYN